MNSALNKLGGKKESFVREKHSVAGGKHVKSKIQNRKAAHFLSEFNG